MVCCASHKTTCANIMHLLICDLGAVAYSAAHFGIGTGPINLDAVGCSGQESVLVQCSHSTMHNCGHSEDAGVSCSQPGQMSIQYML